MKKKQWTDMKMRNPLLQLDNDNYDNKGVFFISMSQTACILPLAIWSWGQQCTEYKELPGPSHIFTRSRDHYLGCQMANQM